MISFIILHYKNVNDTLECIASIHQIITSKEASIVVVDNGQASKEELAMIQTVVDDVVVMNKNVGFANGNNAGCRLAIKKYHPDFLVVINNDTVILQKNFIDLIYSQYNEKAFDMLGPKLVTDGGESVNPFPAYESLEAVSQALHKTNQLIQIYRNAILRGTLKLYLFGKSKLRKHVPLQNGENKQYGVALHGCALIFSKQYYDRYSDVFYAGTFLYHEEEFLKYRVNRDHLVSVYDPKIEIFHKEGSSLNFIFQKGSYHKLLFQQEKIKESLELLKKVMLEGKSI